MQVAMTERDKKLILFLSIGVIIVAIGYWMIRPALKDVVEMKEEIVEQEEVRRINEYKMSQIPVMQEDIEANNEIIRSMEGDYYPMMNSDEIDKYFTGMVLDYGLFAYDLDIQIEDSPASLEPYMYSVSAQEFSDVEYEDSSSEYEENDEEEESEYDEYLDPLALEDEDTVAVNTNIYAANVSMRLGGSEEDMIKLIDDLATPEHQMLIRNYSWTITKNTTAGDSTVLTGDDIAQLYSEMDAGGIFTVIDRMELNLEVTMYMYKE